ncbi:hypothetical protein WJX72_006673 [[Myrmecia] bisecta]|uniref:Uncharacterized protein n=1 Tax=[Myrmecia] bisecta TaxID=41462 RepID=A0AAW1PWZ9_9CHLO
MSQSFQKGRAHSGTLAGAHSPPFPRSPAGDDLHSADRRDLQTLVVTAQQASQGTCAQQGLEGECNGCICCCYSGGGGIIQYKPENCQCKKVVSVSQVGLAVVLSVIVAATTFLSSCYFGGQCPVSPYKQGAGSLRHIEMMPVVAPVSHRRV